MRRDRFLHRGFRELAERRRFSGRRVRHARVGDGALRCAHAELLCGSGDDHLARGRSGDAHAVVAGAAHRQRSARDLKAGEAGETIRAVVEAALERSGDADEGAADVGVRVGIERRRLLDAHEIPIRIHFFRRHHRQRRLRALAHLAVRDEDRDDVVGRHEDPRIQLAGALRIIRADAVAARREDRAGHAEHEAAAGKRAGADERAPCPFAHYAPPSPATVSV